MGYFSIMMRSSEGGDNEVACAMCCLCSYWSGALGNAPSDLICAANVPQLTEEALAAASYRSIYALHNCSDFDEKS